MPKELILRSGFAWVHFSGSNIFSDYVGIYHEPVLVHDWLKGLNDPQFFLFCVSDLFDTAWIDSSKVTLKKLTKHTKSKVTFYEYLFNLVLLRNESEFFKINFTVTTSKATRGKEKEITVKVGDYGITEFIGAFPCRVNSKNNSSIFNKFRPDLGRLVKEISVKTD